MGLGNGKVGVEGRFIGFVDEFGFYSGEFVGVIFDVDADRAVASATEDDTGSAAAVGERERGEGGVRC